MRLPESLPVPAPARACLPDSAACLTGDDVAHGLRHGVVGVAPLHVRSAAAPPQRRRRPQAAPREEAPRAARLGAAHRRVQLPAVAAVVRIGGAGGAGGVVAGGAGAVAGVVGIRGGSGEGEGVLRRVLPLAPAARLGVPHAADRLRRALAPGVLGGVPGVVPVGGVPLGVEVPLLVLAGLVALVAPLAPALGGCAAGRGRGAPLALLVAGAAGGARDGGVVVAEGVVGVGGVVLLGPVVVYGDEPVAVIPVRAGGGEGGMPEPRWCAARMRT